MEVSTLRIFAKFGVVRRIAEGLKGMEPGTLQVSKSPTLHLQKPRI